MEKQFDPGGVRQEAAGTEQTEDLRLGKKEEKHDQRLEEKFEKVFEKENHEGRQPEIDVNIFYSGHWEEKELEGLGEKFAEADIYIPEGCGWTPEVLESFRDCAEGGKMPTEILKELEITPENNPSYPYILKELEMIHGSRKAITFIDIPHDHPFERFGRRPFCYNQAADFENNLDNFKGFLKGFAEINKEREEYMMSQFKLKVRELLEENPALKDKEKLNVLVSLGTSHTGLWHAMKRAGEKVSADFGAWPVIFTFENEVVRKYQFGLEVGDELAARAMLEWEFDSYHNLPPSIDSFKAQKVMRKIFSQFNLEEIRELLVQPYFLMAFYLKFEEKGFEVPESEKEADEFLKK